MTVAGTTSASHSQDGCQPVVVDVGGSTIVPEDCVRPNSPICSDRPDLAITIGVRSTTLDHGAPHSEHTPFSDVPALMHLRGISDTKVAKWASG